jgi:hypothetical protein
VVVVLGAAIYIQSSPLIHIADRIDAAAIDQMSICQEVWGTQDYRPATSHTLFWRGPTPPGDPGDPLVLAPCLGSVTLSPPEARLLSFSRQGTRWEVQYTAAAPSVATIPQYYFPGWRAWVDGVSSLVGPSPGNGLLQIKVPAGEHTVEVEYHDTPVRSAGNVLSLLGMATLVVIAWSARVKARRTKGDEI